MLKIRYLPAEKIEHVFHTNTTGEYERTYTTTDSSACYRFQYVYEDQIVSEFNLKTLHQKAFVDFINNHVLKNTNGKLSMFGPKFSSYFDITLDNGVLTFRTEFIGDFSAVSTISVNVTELTKEEFRHFIKDMKNF